MTNVITPPMDGRPARYWVRMDTPPEGRYVVLLGAALAGQTIEVQVPCADLAEAEARDQELIGLLGQPTAQALPAYAAAVVGRDDATLAACYGPWYLSPMPPRLDAEEPA